LKCLKSAFMQILHKSALLSSSNSLKITSSGVLLNFLRLLLKFRTNMIITPNINPSQTNSINMKWSFLLISTEFTWEIVSLMSIKEIKSMSNTILTNSENQPFWTTWTFYTKPTNLIPLTLIRPMPGSGFADDL
jgi:hypothetical protein